MQRGLRFKKSPLYIDVGYKVCRPVSDRLDSCETVVVDIVKRELVRLGYMLPADRILVSETDLKCEENDCNWSLLLEIYNPETGKIKRTIEAIVSLECENLDEFTLFTSSTTCQIYQITIL